MYWANLKDRGVSGQLMPAICQLWSSWFGRERSHSNQATSLVSRSGSHE